MNDSYYNTKETADEYIKLAEGHNGKALIDTFAKVLPRQSTLLEIGSGPGADWNILKEMYKVTGSDTSPEFLKHLKLTNPKGTFVKLDAATLDVNQKFDGIYSNKVLHHLKTDELIHSIKRQAEVLNSNGIICHSFWKGEGTEVFKGLFVNYHTEQDLRNLFDSYFDIISITHYAEFETDDSIYMIARKK